MKTLRILAPFLVVFTSCTTVENSTRITSSLEAMQFNDVSSRYTGRPTFVSTEKLSDGKTVLYIHMDRYGANTKTLAGIAEKSSGVRFLKERAPDYVAAIDKYLEWAALASQRKDAFTKEIASVPTWANAGTVLNKFEFHSGNGSEHFLYITPNSSGRDLTDWSLVFDERNAKALKSLLVALGSNSLPKTNIDSVYK